MTMTMKKMRKVSALLGQAGKEQYFRS